MIAHLSRRKLTDAQIAEMRQLAAEGWTLVQLAERYGVGETFVSLVLRGYRRIGKRGLVKWPDAPLPTRASSLR